LDDPAILTITRSIPTFKLILNANASIPLVLKDLKDMKGVPLTDISVDKSLAGQGGSFYLSEDAIRIVSTFSGLGSARVVPDPSADEKQKEHFDVFQRRLQSGQMASKSIFIGLLRLIIYLSLSPKPGKSCSHSSVRKIWRSRSCSLRQKY
jgi:hypothetical protein